MEMLDQQLTTGEAPPRRRLLAALVAVAVGAALAVAPAIGATAAEGDDIAALQVAAETARADADAGAAAAATADAEADAAEAAAQVARDAATAARAAVTPDDPGTEEAAIAAEAAADAAEATAMEARQRADAAAASAAELEAAAVAAEAALAAALETEGEPAIEPTTEDAAASSERGAPSCDSPPRITGDDERSGYQPCIPKPRLDVHVTNVCPAALKVELSNLVHWEDYVVIVNGVEYPVEQHNGRAWVKISDVEPGKVWVEVRYGKHESVKDYVWIDGKCPDIRTDVEKECRTISGSAEVEFAVSHLSPQRAYTVTITGPNGYSETFPVAHRHSFERDLWVPPGEYTITVESADRDWPHIGPVSETVVVPPCPGDVTIGFAPECATDGTGTLGATLTGLVPGREYAVTVVGPNGTVLDTTFVADSSSWTVPTGDLPPGSYTVTVVDPHGYPAHEYSVSDRGRPPMKEPLTWSATASIGSCPPVVTQQLATLALTGGASGGLLVPALGMAGVGAALLLLRAARERRQLGL